MHIEYILNIYILKGHTFKNFTYGLGIKDVINRNLKSSRVVATQMKIGFTTQLLKGKEQQMHTNKNVKNKSS